MELNIKNWRYPIILLCSIGVSSVGSWIYFIALNLIVLNITESALAVSGLYIIRALSTVCTNIWSGSVIDRLNKKYLMIVLNMLQALFITVLPFVSSLGFIYCMVFFNYYLQFNISSNINDLYYEVNTD